MNYEKIYNQIIEKARAENRIKGTYVSRIPWNKGKEFSN